MDALIFIVRALLQIVIVVFLLRVLLPLARADSRNQLSQAVIRMTNPLVLPLRRIVPPIGKVDTASIVALLLVQLAATGILWLLMAYPGLLGTGWFLRIALFSLLDTILLFYTYALFLYILLSWVAPGTYSPAASLLQSLCEPLLRPVRRIIPAIAGIDFSALFVIIGLQALYILIS
ncbi:MAG TPA: YggT family protein [Povalibacter sp.]|uniref:YggT family protein n=1 Tax=Povalibacter sp. TaxID=1962978 RepID=UPI002D01E7E7|nr:YggT family protein [Povalibacter sp.]HMN46973.1 YggT family protein [Povalibacter sp.]